MKDQASAQQLKGADVGIAALDRMPRAVDLDSAFRARRVRINQCPDAGDAVLNSHGMMLSTLQSIPGWEVTEFLGAVAGNTVRMRNVLARLGASIVSTFGGELSAYSTMLTDSRNEAMNARTSSCLIAVRRLTPSEGMM